MESHSSDQHICIVYTLFCIGYGICTSKRAPRIIFHNQYKTKYNLFSPDPAVSGVAGFTSSNKHIMKYIAALHLGVCYFFLVIGQMDFINSIFKKKIAKLS